MIYEKLIEKLITEHCLTREELLFILTDEEEKNQEKLFENARKLSQSIFGNKIYIRGLIEFSNYCKNDCYYCGIHRSNANADRYRLNMEQILECCKKGYELGFRTYVFQSGEDGYFTDDRLEKIVRKVKEEYPDCAITLSIGERSYDSYRRLFAAGADRYLLREETINPEHYRKLHPKELSHENRLHCLRMLKDIGYQTGCGFMIQSPFQTVEDIAEELIFIKNFAPHMVGIGPFIPHKDTMFATEKGGTLEMALKVVAILRLMNPNALIPATTAMGTIDEYGREKAILAGANVVMPNLSPESVRKKYLLYDNKICTGDEAAESRNNLEKRMNKIGYQLVTDRGDYKEIKS